jgi:hypothetical protein
MSRTIIVTIFLCGLFKCIFAQEHISIHQRQLEYYSQFNAQTPESGLPSEVKQNPTAFIQ